jgi:aspartate/methionine/tyrosine aminotransferase
MRFNSMFAASIVAAGLVFSVATPVSIAQAADEMAASHESMAKAYTAAGAKGGTQSMVSHCGRLVSQYRAAAREYRSLATEHRALAKAAGK